MALQRYSDAAVYCKSSLFVEHASVSIDRETGAQPVLTVAKGFAGVSPGARMMKIAISSAVPAAGFEYDPGPDMDGLIIVPLQIFAAGKTLITNGYIMQDKFNHAVNQEAKIELDFTCEFAQWQ